MGIEVGLGHFLVVSAILLVLGIFGIFLNRKNVIIILMSIELILLAVNLNLVAFSAALGDLVGQVFAMFVLTVANLGKLRLFLLSNPALQSSQSLPSGIHFATTSASDSRSEGRLFSRCQVQHLQVQFGRAMIIKELFR